MSSLYEVSLVSSLEINSLEAELQFLGCRTDSLCATSGRQIYLLKDWTLKEPSSAIEFDNSITVAGLSEDGVLLVVGDSIGKLYFICPSINLPFHSQKLLGENESFISLKFGPVLSGSCNMLVLSSAGMLYAFGNVLLSQLGEGLVNGNMSLVQQVQSSIVLSKTDLMTCHSDGVCSVLATTDGFLSFGRGDKFLCVWQQGTDEGFFLVDEASCLLKGSVVIRGSLTSSEELLILLTDSFSLTVWPSEFLVVTNVLAKERIKDYVVCPTGNSETLCCLTVEQPIQLLVLTVPVLEEVYHVSVDPSAVLCHGCLAEGVLFFAEATSDNSISENRVVVKRLAQIRPEERLKKLLIEQKFEEAFLLAAKYGLDREVVHRKRVEVINSQLCAATSSDEVSRLLCQLKGFLKEIKDSLFAANLVTSSQYPTLDCVRQLLWCAKRMVERDGRTDKESIDIRDKLYSSLNRIVTYMLIVGDQNYSASSLQEFLSIDLISELHSYVISGDLKRAGCIWSRHQPALVGGMDQSQLVSLLHAVPESVLASDLGPWLKNYVIPLLVLYLPGAWDSFTDWLLDRVSRMELTEKARWPANGLQLLDVVSQTILTCGKRVEQLGIRADQSITILSASHHTVIERVNGLKKKLTGIGIIKSQLDLRITLSDYQEESQESVLFLLLDKVLAPELIPSLLREKINPYCCQYQLSVDTILLHYMKHMLTRIPRLTADSPWEAKAIAVIRSINSQQTYIEGCIELLQGIHTHWSEAVEQMVQDCLSVNHPCVQDLKKQFELLQLRRMLYDYGIRDEFNYSDISQSWMYIRYVLKQAGDNVVQDALKVADLYLLERWRVHMFHVINLGQRGSDKCYEMIGDFLGNHLSSDQALLVAGRAANYALTKLQLVGFEKELDINEDIISTTRTALVCLRFLQSKGEAVTCGGHCVDEMVDVTRRLLGLQEKFSLFISPHDLTNGEKAQALFKKMLLDFLAHQLDDQQRTKGKASSALQEVLYFGKLLGMPNPVVYQELIINCMEMGEYDRAREYCQKLVGLEIGSVQTLAPFLISLVGRIWQHLARGELPVCNGMTVVWMMDLSSLALSCCDQVHLTCCKEVHSVSSFLACVWSHCSIADSSSRFAGVSQHSLFCEDGLVLEPQLVFPLAVRCSWERVLCLSYLCDSCHSVFSHLMKNGGQVINDITAVSSSGMELAYLLRDNSHSQLALDVVAEELAKRKTLRQNTDKWLELEKELIAQLTPKVISARHLDHSYALALLLQSLASEGKEMILSTRQCASSSYTRAKAFCKMAIDYGTITRQKDIVVTSRSFFVAANWGKRLAKYQIQFTQAFRGGPEEKKKVLQKLFECQAIDISTVLEYCRDFELEIQAALLLYLSIVLTSWTCGFHERGQAILALLGGESSCIDLLIRLLTKKISPYDYEHLEVVLSLLASEKVHSTTLNAEHGLKLLECLKVYKRRGPISSTESEWLNKWQELSQTDSEVLVSRDRLPFLPLFLTKPTTACPLLSAELSEDTMGEILPICAILEISQDTVIMDAIMNIVQSKKSLASSSTGIGLHFNKFAPMLSTISSPRKALSITKWLAVELKSVRVEEAIQALTAAVNIAESWKDSASPEEVKQAVEAVDYYRRILQIGLTEQVLCDYGIAKAMLTDLSSQPVQLVMLLYSELPLDKPPIPTVHEIVAKIANVCGLNTPKIRRKLAEEWLPFTPGANRDMNVTQLSMMEDPTSGFDDEEDPESERDMRRLVYLLRVPDEWAGPEELQNTVTFLIKWAKSPKLVGGSRSRIRAMQVLFAVASVDFIEEISGASVKEIRDYLQLVLFVAELESLRMNTSLGAFQSCNKEGLVRTLWKNHSQEPRAVRLVSELCLHYKLHDPPLWSKLLNQLLNLNMMAYVRYLLKTHCGTSLLWTIPGIVEVWGKALIIPVKEASNPPTFYQKQECAKSLQLLQICPFVSELDIEELVNAYHTVGMFAHAVLCTAFIPEQRGQVLAQNILGGLDGQERRAVEEEVQELGGAPVCAASYSWDFVPSS